jgi:hypothetical protein
MPDPDQRALGAAVKAIREEKNISQVALQEQLPDSVGPDRR